MIRKVLTAAASCMLVVAGAAKAEPASWLVFDEDSTMVFYPTVHILPDDVRWQSQRLMRNLARADEVWFEILPAEGQNEDLMPRLARIYGLSPNMPLSRRLDSATYKEFQDAAEALGMSVGQLDSFRPWLAALTLTVADLERDGFDPESGVEVKLSGFVPASKHRALETAEQQLQFFANLPEEVELAFFKSTLEEVGQSADYLRDMVDAWVTGDIAELETLLIGAIRDQSEELYQILLVKRNEDWAARLSEELEGSGHDFVAVGAGHLLGEDSLLQMLKDRGYSVRRLN